jgi:tetratricopeptide (TPR) repeat protein
MEKSALCRTPKRATFPLMKSMFRQFLRAVLAAVLALAVMVLAKSSSAESVPSYSPPALTNWQKALITFRKVGRLIGQANYQQAQTELSRGATNLPAPYGGMASQFLTRLESTLKQWPDQNDSRRKQTLVQLCAELHAYDDALRLAGKRSAEELEDDPVYAWRLLESGDTKAAAAEYKRKLDDEPVDMWRDYYRNQLRLIEQRPTNLTNVTFTLEFVKLHYLSGYEEKADLFGALEELTRVLPQARTPKEAVTLHQAIIKTLSGLADDAGRDAWENKLLRDFATNTEACAGVHLARGLRAYAKKDYAVALVLLRKVCSEYPDSDAYGDAQFSIGTLFQDQQKYDEAIPEFTKLFTSKVNDYKIDPESSEDYPNYRHRAAMRISECYEAKKDFVRALENAELARDRYPILSYCKTCLKDTKESLDKRIARLQAAVKESH